MQMKVVSGLHGRSDGQRRRHWRDGRWVTAHDCNDLISVHFQARVEANDDVVGEDALRVLLRSASFQWQLDLVAQVAFANDLASAVTIEVRVGDAVKLFVKLHIHLSRKQRETFSDSFCTKKEFLIRCDAHTAKRTHSHDAVTSGLTAWCLKPAQSFTDIQITVDNFRPVMCGRFKNDRHLITQENILI